MVAVTTEMSANPTAVPLAAANAGACLAILRVERVHFSAHIYMGAVKALQASSIAALAFTNLCCLNRK
jgi:hypothetical protein